MRKVLGTLVVIVLSGCGGGGGGPTAETIDPKLANQVTVDAAVLQASDLPGTWNTNRSATTSDTIRDKVSQAAAECFKTEGDDRVAIAIREFLSGQSLGHVIVRGELEMHTDAASITGKLSAFTQSDAASCVKQYIEHLFTGSVVGELAIAPSKVEGVGDEQGGFVITAPVSSNDNSFTIGADIVFNRVGRFRATVSVITFDVPPDHALAVAGMRAMVRRLQE